MLKFLKNENLSTLSKTPCNLPPRKELSTMFDKFNTQTGENQAFAFLRSEIMSRKSPRAAMSKLCGGIRPSRVRVDLNDKLAKTIFKLSDERTERLLQGKTSYIVEKEIQKIGEITTAYHILNAEGYQVVRPFNMFDRFVLSACISEWLAGNHYTTVAIIYRALTGKIGKGDSKPSVTQRKTIIESLGVLMNRIIDYNAEDLSRLMDYDKSDALYGKGPLLSAMYVDFSALDSENDTLIFFTSEPTLLKLSKIKKQLVSYDATLLDMPGQNTPMNITAKNYAMLRVQEIKLHRQLTPTITFDDVFRKLRIENSSTKTKMDVRNTMLEFFDHLKNENIVKDFEVVKHGNTFYSIKFPRPQKSWTITFPADFFTSYDKIMSAILTFFVNQQKMSVLFQKPAL